MDGMSEEGGIDEGLELLVESSLNSPVSNRNDCIQKYSFVGTGQKYLIKATVVHNVLEVIISLLIHNWIRVM